MMKRHRRKSAADRITSEAIKNITGQYAVSAVSSATGVSLPAASAAFSIHGASLVSKAVKALKV